MHKTVTFEILKTFNPCVDALEWAEKTYKPTANVKSEVLIKDLMSKKRYEWANWLIVRLMDKPQYVAYAIYAAEQVIDIYEKKYPNDVRPRKAIEAAKEYLKNPSEENKCAAANAARAAARAAANAAYAAADAAAYAAADAAADAAYAAADAARKKLQIKILKYGLKLMREAR